MPIESKVALGFSVALLVLAIIGVVTYRSMTFFIDTTKAVENSHVILRQLDLVPAHIADAEAGTRGFVITGNREYLAGYESARSALGRRQQELQLITVDSIQQRRLDELDRLITRRLDVSQRTVELRARGDADSAAAFVRTGVGRVLSDSIRGLISVIEAREGERLHESAIREQSAARRVRFVTTAGFLIAFVISVLATLIVRRDVAERARVERAMFEAKEAAEAANRSKSDFLARMSHELRTPLNSVIGFSNVLLKNRAGNLRPQDLTFLHRIAAGGEHLLTLINDVLDLSKIEAGRMTIDREPVAIGALVRDVIESLEGQLQASEVVIRTVLPHRLATIEADPVRLHQVLANLIGNAIKFTEHGSVTVTVAADARSGRPLRLDVADTGIGIDTERQAAIFETFEQADSTTTRRFGGTGLGLAIARSLCELMGFELELAWSEPARGSVFSVRFVPDAPRYAGGAPAAADELASPA